MKGFLNFFARWVVPVLGLLALSLIIWFLGPLLRLGNYEPLASATSRWVLIVLLFLVWIGFRVLRIVQARRNAAKVMQSLAEVSAPDAASVATAEELATLKQRMDEALALLKRAKLGGSERRNLYELPWYVIIGPPGSGKTTALMNSGLDFPLAAQMGAGAIRGVGGTRNCDWWFTDEAVLLDTAGRYTTQDSHAQVDKAAWLGFLDLLKTQRKRRPIDGAFIAISLSDLLLGSDAEPSPNPRFMVTSLAAAAWAPKPLYEELYCARGEMENRIKECQLDLFADRTSTGTMRANQLRLWFASLAYVLLEALRRIALPATRLAQATAGTIRLRLLKIGALVGVSVRRVAVQMASGHPWQRDWAIAYQALSTAAG